MFSPAFPTCLFKFSFLLSFWYFEEPLCKMLNLVFLYAPNCSSCSKTICANPLDVQLLPISRCGLGKGLEQCCSNANVVQGTWAILLKYKFHFSYALGPTCGMAMVYQWFLTWLHIGITWKTLKPTSA